MMSSVQRSDRFAGLFGGAVLLALMTGCASPGVPRAPSLHLPERITNLSAERQGADVRVRFVTPQHTTDGESVTSPVAASLCRAVGDGPCRPTTSFPGKTTVDGPVEWVDVLPPELTAGAPRRLAYRVELFNVQGRSAGPSEPAFAAAGEAPHGVDGLRAEGSRAGIALRWTAEAQSSGEVLVKRESLAPPPSTKAAAPAARSLTTPKSATSRKAHVAVARPTPAGKPDEENIVWLHTESGGDSGGMIDATANADEPYRYTAVRSHTVTLDGRKLELRSEPPVAVAITMKDVYPPAVPQGLLAAGFPVQGADTIAVDLVWQPNTENDLAGYNVYRQLLVGEGPAVKLNAKLVKLPSFHDATAARGVGYRYTVTAVDARGNESAASAAAELAATP